MKLTHEDVLRELELLPVWRLHNPKVMASSDAQAALVETQTQPNSLLPLPAETKQITAVANQDNELEPKISMPWVLVYHSIASQKEESLTLVQNIVRAMRLLQGEYLILDDVDNLQNYHINQLLVFGLVNVPEKIKSQGHTIDVLRGKPHQLSATTCWVTYGVDDMLGNPSLKAMVWQDLKNAMQQQAV